MRLPLRRDLDASARRLPVHPIVSPADAWDREPADEHQEVRESVQTLVDDSVPFDRRPRGAGFLDLKVDAALFEQCPHLLTLDTLSQAKDRLGPRLAVAHGVLLFPRTRRDFVGLTRALMP